MEEQTQKTVSPEQDIPDTEPTEASKQQENKNEGQAEQKKQEKEEKNKKNKASKVKEEMQKKLDDLNNTLLHTLAEYDNYRKRTQKEKDGMYADGIMQGVKAFLPVVDNLERALAACEEQSALKDGVVMILNQMNETLKNLGVTEFGKSGEPFDPNCHAAVMHIEDENLPENSIAEVLQKGYIYKDEFVIRHATVKVAN